MVIPHNFKTYRIDKGHVPEILHKLAPMCQVFSIIDQVEREQFFSEADVNLFIQLEGMLDDETSHAELIWLVDHPSSQATTHETWCALDLITEAIMYYQSMYKNSWSQDEI